MGQIVGGAAKPKRCNANKLSQLGTPAAGEHILVSSDNSMNAAGQGNFDCYIEGNGTKAATALAIKKFNAETDKIIKDSNFFPRETLSPVLTNASYRLNGGGTIVSDTNYQLKKYEVSSGDVLCLKLSADGLYTAQFQSNISSNAQTLVGKVYVGEIDGLFVVPNGATRLCVSMLKTNTTDVVERVLVTIDEIATGGSKHLVSSNGVVAKIDSRLGNEATQITTAGTAGEFVPFNFQKGHTYQITSNWESGLVSLSTALDNVTIPTQGDAINGGAAMSPLRTAIFTATKNASYLRVGVNSTNTPIELMVYDLGSYEVSKDYQDKLIGTDFKIYPNVVNGSYYDTTGAAVERSGFKRISIDLSEYPCKQIKFMACQSGYARYGFVVNGAFNENNYPTAGFGYVTMVVPFGATELRVSWSTQLFTDNDVTIIGGNIENKIVALEAHDEDIISKLNAIADAQSSYFLIDNGITFGNGGILTETGEPNDNMTYKHAIISLDGSISKLKFVGSEMGSAVALYGFIINGVWVGTHVSYPTATDVEIDVPNGATECRINWNRNYVTQYLVTAYGISGKSAMTLPKYQFETDFVLSRVPQVTCPTLSEAIGISLTDFYAKYDALVTQYPLYVSRLDCEAPAQAALGITKPSYLDGMPIYMYKFTPVIARNGYGVDNIGRIRVLLGTQHPQERLGDFTLFETMKMICENWKNDVNAEMLRSFCEFYVIPIPWPWNFVNNSRKGYNGINANRQYPTKQWAQSGTQGGDDWSGTEPLSEYEAKVMAYWLAQIKPHVSVDIHTSGNDDVGHMGVLLVNRDVTSLVDLCGVIARTTSNRAIQDNENFPQEPNNPVYGVLPETGYTLGEFYEYAYEQGCKYSILSEESPYSKWSNGVLTENVVAQYTDQIFRENIQYLFNTILRLVYAASREYYNEEE